ncbi:hypothetical protein [Chitinophaga tropicalis]|uniref:Uncharacterized protein n=1 Tax=Chitinophaga tropicalis TaxID=2683588 RepID=A0A7K1U332_9BACT|nr:hypothetical protein [Chitinophaga tropicalis]MVT08774.1 hypothetical protein [Chitinophaga tropicalis]
MKTKLQRLSGDIRSLIFTSVTLTIIELLKHPFYLKGASLLYWNSSGYLEGFARWDTGTPISLLSAK